MAKTYSVGWRSLLKEITDIDEEYSKYSRAYTEVERLKLLEKRKKKVEFQFANISKGVTGELFESVEKLQSTRERLQLYKKSELKSWDSAKLQSEYGVMSVVLDMATVGTDNMTGDTTFARVKKLWKEASDSGDKYKIRALADLLDGIIVKAPDRDEALQINGIKFEAQKTLQELRETPDIAKTKQEVQTAFDGFSSTLREYKRAGEAINASSGFDWNIRNLRIKEDEDRLPFIEIMETGKMSPGE